MHTHGPHGGRGMAARTALITGGAGGIGAAVARRLSRAGMFALVAGRDPEKLGTVVGEIVAAGGRAAPVRLDLEDSRSVAGVREAVAAAGQDPDALDALVNVAGIAISAPLLASDISSRLFERHLVVNFHGPRALIESFAPAMGLRGTGRIVNVASSAGLRGYAYTAAYCASKHALIGYVRAAALELAGSGVAISAVCPHFVDSPLTDASVRRIVEKTGRTPEEARAFLASQNPGGRLIACEEVAEVVLTLIEGDENGTILELDGARVLRVEGPVTKPLRKKE